MGNSLAVQWLGPGTVTAGGLGSIHGWGTKILRAAWCNQKKNFFFNKIKKIEKVFALQNLMLRK